jgi:hypothetical protein
MTSNDRPPTSDRLRINIDRGLTGDKVAWPDPAAAPLGTDDEAGGAPPTAEQCALAAAYEKGSQARERTARGSGGWALTAALLVSAACAVLLLAAR